MQESLLLSILLLIALLLLFSHFLSYFFARYKIPKVIGEITSGILLGPTILGIASPDLFNFLINNESSKLVSSLISELGLILLMFCSGLEFSPSFNKSEKKLIGSLSVIGTFLPLILGYVFFETINLPDLPGPNFNLLSLKIIFCLSLSVTSIPVISKIFMDLKIIGTRFSKVVISTAILEDAFLYVLLSVALAQNKNDGGWSLYHLLNLPQDEAIKNIYHFASSVLFFAFSIFLFPKIVLFIYNLRINFLKKNNPIAFFLFLILFSSALSLFLGLAPMLGAFLAGIITKNVMEKIGEHQYTGAIKDFSFAFFIPMYFCLVGVKLNLLKDFYFAQFISFLGLACFIKIVSVFMAGRFAGATKQMSLNFAMAMNARGGPGIVIASLAFNAKIISESFFVSLVLTAIFTSYLAGVWLKRQRSIVAAF